VTTAKCPVNHGVFDENYMNDPYATYARLHEAGTVHRVVTPEGFPAWLVTGFAETRDALADRRLARSIKHAGEDYLAMALPDEFRTKTVATEDGDDHMRLRKFMNNAFAMKRVRAMRPRVVELTERFIDEMGESGEGDLMTALALPLPITITGDLMGVPDEDRTNFRHWSDSMLGINTEIVREAGVSMLTFLRELIAKKRVEPGDDVFSEWIHDTDAQGNHLDDHELIGQGFMVLLGGYDTTVGMIGGAMIALLSDREKLERLRAEPQIFPSAVEELLRLYGTAHTGVRRFATEDLSLGGADIKKGDVVLCSMGAADRDPRQFPDPDTVDFDRSTVSHIAFGQGPHYCPGSELGRMEISIAIEALLRRLPNLELTVPAASIAWRESYTIRVPKAIPIRY
jgi:cytochrome P450